MSTKIPPEKLHTLCCNKDIYIWGARTNGIAFSLLLKKLKIHISGFLDDNESFIGRKINDIPVYSPTAILLNEVKSNIFVFVAIGGAFRQTVIERCEEAGLVVGMQYLHSSAVQRPRRYTIEASSRCNLQCISCCQGNKSAFPKTAGDSFLSVKNAIRALEKISEEDPSAFMIEYYNWGEPTLNANLSEILCETKKRGFHSIISSNMNYQANWKSLVKAGIGTMLIGVSGNEFQYSVTHTGGKWDRFMENLKQFIEARRVLDSNMDVFLSYFCYADTQEEDYLPLVDLCNENNINFDIYSAFLQPFDSLADYAEGKPLPPGYAMADSMLIVPTRQTLKFCLDEKGKSCPSLNTITMDQNLNMRRCFCWGTNNENDMQINFLSTSLEQILEKQTGHSLCLRCRKHGLHRYMAIHFSYRANVDGKWVVSPPQNAS